MSRKFGSYVRKLRGKRTRRAVAEAAGISAEYLRLIEDEDRIPQKDKQLNLARALGVDEKEFLSSALYWENREVHRILTGVEAGFPKLRKTLLDRLVGDGKRIARSDIISSKISPHERQAALLWAAVWFRYKEGTDARQSESSARESVKNHDFVECQLNDFVADNLASWNVDVETGNQVHLAKNERIASLAAEATAGLGVRTGWLDNNQ